MEIEAFDYHLPVEQIAQNPTAQREASRLLVLNSGADHSGMMDAGFHNLPQLLNPGDLLVLNNTRVINARLFGEKDTGGQAEILVERVETEHQALCMVRVSKPLQPGKFLNVGRYRVECLEREGQFYRLRFNAPVHDALEECGTLPLPPYVDKTPTDEDLQRYQTVFATSPGAVAAPTAGLHFSNELLANIHAKGIQTAELTLHIGAGTFQPVRGRLADHVMHSEYCDLAEETIRLIEDTRASGGRVVAVGTTVVRTLESAALANGGRLEPYKGETRLFIQPGFKFHVVDALITNFHLPKSTLLMLICAFGGYQEVMAAYAHAVASGYRFFSYGDAMFLANRN